MLEIFGTKAVSMANGLLFSKTIHLCCKTFCIITQLCFYHFVDRISVLAEKPKIKIHTLIKYVKNRNSPINRSFPSRSITFNIVEYSLSILDNKT